MNNRLTQANLRALPSAAVIRVAHPGKAENAIPGALIHASGRGIKVSISEKLSSGTAVTVEVPGGRLTGHVSICLNDGRGFTAYIGVEAVTPSGGDLGKLLDAVGSRDEVAVESDPQVVPVRVRQPSAG